MFLVDNNGHAQVFDGVGVWLGEARQEGNGWAKARLLPTQDEGANILEHLF